MPVKRNRKKCEAQYVTYFLDYAREDSVGNEGNKSGYRLSAICGWTIRHNALFGYAWFV